MFANENERVRAAATAAARAIPFESLKRALNRLSRAPGLLDDPSLARIEERFFHAPEAIQNLEDEKNRCGLEHRDVGIVEGRERARGARRRRCKRYGCDRSRVCSGVIGYARDQSDFAPGKDSEGELRAE